MTTGSRLWWSIKIITKTACDKYILVHFHRSQKKQRMTYFRWKNREFTETNVASYCLQLLSTFWFPCYFVWMVYNYWLRVEYKSWPQLWRRALWCARGSSVRWARLALPSPLPAFRSVYTEAAGTNRPQTFWPDVYLRETGLWTGRPSSFNFASPSKIKNETFTVSPRADLEIINS